ncbi:MAG: class I SAM-dependent methyltransferase [Gemmataceae bacterium]|nr:class I SAM-dependent methyltransferase [Gemmataceae bacterium]MCI0743526.1 class I SAM-dependent methyltransferase [Gemmataceae bacterium]
MTQPLEWSDAMERVFKKHVVEPVMNDPRTDWSQDVSLGYPFQVIRKQVIKVGLADFSKGFDDGLHGPLTPEDKVLLYCFVNMKSHFFTSFATFKLHKRSVGALLKERPLVIDVGCGPATALLAFADVFPSSEFDYIGIDAAQPMLEKADELWNAAVQTGMLSKKSRRFETASWVELPKHPFGTNNWVLLVFSYFFASQSLRPSDIHSLATTVDKLRKNRPGKVMLIFHVNSPLATANRNYHVFKKLLGIAAPGQPLTPAIVTFRKKKGSLVSAPVEYVHELLRL